APVRVVRIGYSGELGWELHIPAEFAAHVYDLLWKAGQAHSIRNIGYRVIDSLRMEKGYLYWSADITPDYSPIEAGLGGRVHLKSGGDFIGRKVLAAQKASGPARVLCCFTSPDDLPLYGGEPILLDGKVVSLVTSAAFGHTVGRTILFGYLPGDLGKETDFTLEAFARQYPVIRATAPLYDAENRRLKS
ncbi:MAG: glycine cleavage T C-terminal barrel domain-containing protein, partial [Paracoccaceae bacterium]